MKIISLLFLCLCISLPAFAEEIIGTWKYRSYVYDGQPYPPSNPDLEMLLQFSADGISVLRWQVKGEKEFCERKALYLYKDEKYLYQKIVWSHPGNHSSCSADPDMQLGRESWTEVKVTESRLELILQLSDKPYIYLFDRIGQ